MTSEATKIDDVLMRVTYRLRLTAADQERIMPLVPEDVLTRDDYEARLAEALPLHLPDLLDRAIDDPECEES